LPSCRARDPLTSCEPEFGRGDGEMLTDTYVGAYPPTYYALVGWPSLFAAGEAGLFGMRVASGLLCAALVASGITSAVGTSRRFLLVGYVLAITPVVVFLPAAINPI